MILLIRGVWGHAPPEKCSNLGAQKLLFSAGHFQEINMRKGQYFIVYFTSLGFNISKVQYLRKKKGQNSDALKKVTSRGQDVCPSDWQIHQNNAKDLSIILI